MAYLRAGTCNRCGECCGYPRASDGGQNNPWPGDWPESIRSWTPESIQLYLPILQFSANMVNTLYGNFTIQGKRCYWIWITGKGLCTDTPAYGDTATYDQRCPLLEAKQGNGQVPCRLIGTRYEYVWTMLCEPVPPMRFDSQAALDNWHTNCPSCSYVFVAE